MDFRQLLVKTKNQYQNIQENNNHTTFECEDFFVLPNLHDVMCLEPEERIKQSFSICDKKPSNNYWLIDSSTFHDIFMVDATGDIHTQNVTSLDNSSALKCTINTKKLLALKQTNPIMFSQITKNLNADGDKHYLTFGEYPQDFVNESLNATLEELFNNGNVKEPLTNTGKWVTVNGNKNLLRDRFLPKLLPEFEYNGNKFVRLIYFNFYDKIEIKWQKVTQIEWLITNWQENSTILTGLDFAQNTQNNITCISKNAIISNLPYHTLLSECNNLLWQNSIIRAFANSANLQTLDKDSQYLSVTEYNFEKSGFMHQAMNLDRKESSCYNKLEKVTELLNFAFCGCVNFDKIIIPNNITAIGKGCFDSLNDNVKIIFKEFADCPKIDEDSFKNANFACIYITKDAKHTIITKKENHLLNNTCFKFDYSFENIKMLLNSNYRKNYILMNSLQKSKAIKFVPPKYTLEVFPNECIENYYINRNYLRWKKLTEELEFIGMNWQFKDEVLSSLMKIYYALGGFSKNQGESEKAYNFILKHAYDDFEEFSNNTKYYLSTNIVTRYSNIKLNGEYNKDFAHFFMKFFKKDFMVYSVTDKYGQIQKEKDFLPDVHNNFANIINAYPNKKVATHDKRTLITPHFLADHCNIFSYDGINQDNKMLAKIIQPYGYTQKDFETMQSILQVAKQIKDQSSIICSKDNSYGKITYRKLEKDSVEGFVLGDKTNSCLKLNKLGETCLKDGYINPDACFVVFEQTNKINNEKSLIAHAYVWYDKVSETICFDNIDLPYLQKTLLEKSSNEDQCTYDDLLVAIDNCAKSIYETMNKTNNKVKTVTIGLGHCYIEYELCKKYKVLDSNLIKSHNLYRGFTDADKKQVEVINTR